MFAAALLSAVLCQAAVDPASGRGSISGRVTDQGSGQPLSRIVVTISSADRVKQIETLTDKDGRYTFTDLAAATYTVGADNDDHVATYLPRWFGGDPPAKIEIGSSESRANVDIALARALAIEGRVFDPQGEPLRGVDVSITPADGQTARPRGSTTDDLGAYRVYGLRAGQYRVCGAILDGPNVPADGALLGKTCYPDMALTSQDSFNIDIHMQARDGSPDTAAAPARGAYGPVTTGTIRGVVSDKQTGRPIPRAIVHLGFRGGSRPPGDLTTGTNAAGVFTFSGLTPGQYDGFATAAGHVREPLTDDGYSRLFTVQRGGTLQVSVGLPRAYAITVRLIDAFDTPVAAVGLSARALDGREVLFPFQHSSDDLGRVRLPDLPPGRYLLCAEPGGSSDQSPSVVHQKRDRLLRTCYPSALTDAEAHSVVIDNTDVDGVEIRTVRGRTPSISGTIVDSSGVPAGQATVQLQKFTANSVSGTWFHIEDHNGRFQVSNLQPGAYAVVATLGDEAAFVPLRLDNDDIENLVIGMWKTAAVAGHVVGADPAAPPPTAATDRAPLLLTARLVDDGLPGDGSSIHATPDSDGTFVLKGVFGRRRLDVQNAPPGWYVQAIRYGATDVTDRGVEFKNGGQPLDIVLSDRGATLSGTIADIVDKRVARARVFLLRAPAFEKDTPRLAGAVLSTTGSYAFGPLRAGDYVVVAVPADTPAPGLGEPDRLAALVALGEHVTVTDLEQRTVQVHITAIR